MCRTNLLLALAATCCLNSVALAEKGDLEKPLSIESDNSCKIDERQGRSVCTGNVVIKQGSLSLHAETVVFVQENGNVVSAQGSGKPVKFRQKMDDQDWFDAEALQFDYDAKKGKLVLTEKVVVRKGQDETTASKIVYDLNGHESEVFGSPGKRARLVFQPKKKEPQDVK